MKKIFLVSIIIFLAIIFVGNISNAAIAAPPKYLGITELRQGGTGYAIGNPGTNGITPTAAKLWNIIEYAGPSSNSVIERENMYCLRAGVGFTSGENKRGTYNLFFDMYTERAAISSQNTILENLVNASVGDVNRYNAILALLDIMYFKGESSESDKVALISNAGIFDGEYSYDLTDDDIAAIQQAVIWYLTNSDEAMFDKTASVDWFNYTTNGTTYSPLSDYKLHDTYEGIMRSEQAGRLYNYLINTAKINASSYAGITSSPVPATINTTTLNYTESGANYIVGPIKITETTGNIIPYTIDFVVKNGGSVTTGYTLLDKNKNTVSVGTTVKNLVGDDFYISIPKSSITTLSIDMKINYSKTSATLWASSTNNQEQPVLIAKKENANISRTLTVTPELKEFDLALRKYITKVNEISLTGTNSRVPNISETTLVTGTTATYRHKKDPVVVKTGDRVTYNLSIYNEGEKAGRATKIVDQLPTGLKFISIASGNFELDSYSESNNTLNLKRKSGNTENLAAYVSGNLKSETIEIICEVVAYAGANEIILTNVAWIEEEYDAEDGVIITNQSGRDRDSEPATRPNVNKDNMSDDTGNGNKADLTDSNYYYKGEQDDDDFEKLKLEKAEGKYNLEITKVDSTNVNTKLQGAVFKVTLACGTEEILTTNSSGVASISDINISAIGTDIIKIEEQTAPSGYEKLINTVEVNVTKAIVSGKYQATGTSLKTSTSHVSVALENGTIKITVKNEIKILEGKYDVEITKVDSANTNTKLQGAVFKVTLADGTEKTLTTNSNGIASISDVNISAIGTDIIKIEEQTAPSGYEKLIDMVEVNVAKAIVGGKYQATGTSLKTSTSHASVTLDGETIKITIKNEEKEFDLALRKYITKVNEINLTGANSRIPNISETTLVTGTTATYRHKKDPIVVKTGDRVTYNLSIYNEGEKAGRATKIVDQLPTGLKFISIASGNFELDSYSESNNTLNLKRKSGNTENLEAYIAGNLKSETIEIVCEVVAYAGANEIILTNVAWIEEEYDAVTNETIITQVGKDRDSEPGTRPNVNKDNMSDYTGNGNKADLADSNYYYKGEQDDDDFEKLKLEKAEGKYNLEIIKVDSTNVNTKLQGAVFKVTLACGTEEILTTNNNGIATISDINILSVGTEIIKIEEQTAPSGYEKLINTVEINVTKAIVDGKYVATNTEMRNTQTAVSVKLEDGVIKVTIQNKPKVFDLALRKYITKINETILENSDSRIPNIDETTLEKEETATYKHKKDPVVVKTGDRVTYNLSIYNEGGKEGRATKVVDQLPTGLKFSKVISGNFELDSYNEASNTLNLKRKSGNTENLAAYKKGELKSETIEIECEVVAYAGENNQILTNVAWIEEEYNAEDGITITNQSGADIDSEPGTKPNVDKDNMSDYTGSGNKADLTDSNYYYKGQQDDDDFEKLMIKKAEGTYDIELLKIDSKIENKRLQGAEFKVTLACGTVKTVTTGNNGIVKISGIEIDKTGTEVIKIEETKTPIGYKTLINSPINVTVTKSIIEGEFVVTIANLEDINNSSSILVENGAIKVTIKNEPKEFDLALRKYITKVNQIELTGDTSRVPNINLETLDIGTTATYNHKKDSVLIKTGDIITYNLSIYNEGEKEGRATKVVDQLPTGLKFKGIVSGNFELDSYDESTNILRLKRIEGNVNNLEVYTKGDLKSETIEFECEVIAKPDSQNSKIFTNVAWIEEAYDSEWEETITTEVGKDRDSEPGTKPDVNKDNMSEYTGNSNKEDLTDSNYYYKGQQDDDDFEKLVMLPESFDLKLIKKIMSVNNKEVPERIENVDVSKLNNLCENGNIIITNDNGDELTTAIYELNKEPIEVKKGDIVTYTFRVYNEGTIDGYASKIAEKIPKGLEFMYLDKTKEEIEKDETLTAEEKEAIIFNKEYLWTPSTSISGTDTDGWSSGIIITEVESNYLSKENETFEGENLIKAFGLNDGTKIQNDLSYKEISIKLKVISDDIRGTVIRNEAAITKSTDEEGNETEDRDSSTTIWKKYEDDEDYDNIILKAFDLSLRKFIVAVSKDDKIEELDYITNEDGTFKREPIVDTSKLNTLDENGKLITTAEYIHTKEPVIVGQNNLVIYTLRIYNEGDEDGYASEIKDHLPNYLEFVKGEFNDQYGWEISEDGREVTTRYLENTVIEKAKLNEDGEYELSYVDVKIMCKVSQNAITDENITNIADITEYLDEDKREVEDRDSEKNNVELPDDKDLPEYKSDENGNYIKGQQDDDDFEKLIIKKFDLALRKWVTQAIVIENGNKVVTNTGHDPWDDPEGIVKVDLDRKKLEQVTVKFKYSIRVYNQGDLEGYAKQVKDYIPEGLKFIAEENPGWIDEGNNVISTRLLEETLLKPGEYADVEVVLTWINSANNMGLKVNIAEISEDENEYGVPDIDSVPDNERLGEDDIDDAPVMLSIKTGQIRIYFTLGFTILIILSGGVILIKKYVLV